MHIHLSPCIILPLQQFIPSISSFSFQQKYFKWQSYIKQLKQSQSVYYQQSLQKFVQYYPFNHTYWIELIDIILKKPKSKAAAVKMYQIALMKNSRCIQLWKSYLNWLKCNISKSDPNYLKAEYEKATKIIGTHYYAGFVFEEYFQLENDLFKKIQAMKKALVSPLKQIDQIYDIIVNYLDAEIQGFISNNIENIQILVKLQELSITESIKNKQKYIQQVKQKLKQLMRKLYQPTKKHVQLRYPFQSKLSLTQYQPFQSSFQTWRQYLHFIKNSGNFQFVYPLYQRALIQLCDKQTLWEDYFLILQSQGNYNRVLYLLRSHAKFFEQLSKNIAYYWLEIEERESPQKARELYIQLERKQNNLQAYMRHIQLQLRAKQYSNAKILYQTILTVFTSNLSIISYIILQYAQFTIKYFRDIQFSKKLLKTYFQSSPYNQYLFLGYLQFYITHVEYKQNNKDSKQVYEEFMGIVVNGVRRAMENGQNERKVKVVKKVVNKMVRDYVTSIYLVKAAERRIKQVEFKIFRNNQQSQSLKRSYHELGNME